VQLVFLLDNLVVFDLTHQLNIFELIVDSEIHISNEKDIIKLRNTFDVFIAMSDLLNNFIVILYS